MRMKKVFAAGLIALTSVATVQAQEMIDGNSAEQVLEVARSHGTAKLTRQNNGDLMIRGRIEGIRYNVYFMNCIDNANCSDLNFYTGFEDIKPGFEVMNEWNVTKRFGKAYIDNVGDVNIEWDVNLEPGISRANLDATFVRWTQVMDQFSRYVGWQ